MAAGVSDRLWLWKNIVVLIDARAPKPGKRGLYKRRFRERTEGAVLTRLNGKPDSSIQTDVRLGLNDSLKRLAKALRPKLRLV
jgi:hypothetical protein